jgi:hypothetical protein
MRFCFCCDRQTDRQCSFLNQEEEEEEEEGLVLASRFNEQRSMEIILTHGRVVRLSSTLCLSVVRAFQGRLPCSRELLPIHAVCMATMP